MAQRKINRWGVAAIAAMFALTACASERSEAPDGPQASGSSPATNEASMFGTLESPCGDGDAKGAGDQGVTDSEIVIGYGDDRGFTNAPGLNREMGDAMEAMVAWCNEQGGINGREIVGKMYDAAYFNTDQVMKKACGEVFMLVGQGFAGDEKAEKTRVGCNLPTVPGFTISPNAAMGPMSYQPLPYPVDKYSGAGLDLMIETYPEFKESFDFVSSDSPFAQMALVKIEAALKRRGVEPKNCGVEVASAGGDNYRALVQRFKDCGVKALWNTSSATPTAFAFVEAMAAENVNPTRVNEATWYTHSLLEANASGAFDGQQVLMQNQPFENADLVPAVQKYLDILKKSGGDTSMLGMQSTSAFLLWATVAQECGSDLTRQCMVNGLSKVTSWDSGGLQGEANPGENLPTACFLMVEINGKAFAQSAPAERGEWYCDPKAIEDTDPKTWGLKLDENRHATTYLSDSIIVPES